MQVHGNDVVTASRLQHVGHKARGDGCSRFVLLILAGVGEVGKDGGNAARGGGFAGVDHNEELHETIVDIAWRSGLEDED